MMYFCVLQEETLVKCFTAAMAVRTITDWLDDGFAASEIEIYHWPRAAKFDVEATFEVVILEDDLNRSPRK